MNDRPPSIALTTARGSAYSIAASAVTISLGLLRTYLMVRFLLPDAIGLAALALFYVELSQRLTAFGLRSAYVHLQERGESGRGTYLLLNLGLGAASLLLVVLLAPLIATYYPAYANLDLVIRLYAALHLVKLINTGRETFLEMELAFGRLAVADVIASACMLLVGPGMAYLGFGVWAIVGEFGSGMAARFIYLQLLPGEKVAWRWDRVIAKRLWEYGRSVWAGANLTFLNEFFDDFWVGTTLGQSPLGLYNKAYEFAQYPRRVIANPILSVFYPAYARLQADRARLSTAFFRSTSLMVRAGALLSLLVILSAPEVFRLILPEAWQPMRLTFQLLVVYTFFDPLSLAATRLLMAVGRPDLIARVRALQTLVFIPAVVLGTRYFGINGAAIAADLMIFLGAVLLFRHTRLFVDYSSKALWNWPLLAMMGIGTLIALLGDWVRLLPDLWALVAKLTVTPVLFGAILWAGERDQLLSGWRILLAVVRKQPGQN